MKVSQHPAVMILATRKDGTTGTGSAEKCLICRHYKVEFLTSLGARDMRPDLPVRESVCVKSEPVPCPNALRAARWVAVLKELTR